MKAQVVIPSYNSRDNLARNLPPLLAALEGTGAGVTVVDDASTDGTPDLVAAKFPQIRLIRKAVNRGFGDTCNLGVRDASDADVVVLLNADVEVRAGFLMPLLRHFDQADVFAVASVSIAPDGSGPEDGLKIGRFVRGHLKWEKTDMSFVRPELGALPTLYAVGGHAAYHREKFLSLGGFDDLYLPFYWEDGDLGYAAWKRGWRVLLEPASVVWHRHQDSDIGKTHRERVIADTIHRNRFLFTWKHIHDPSLLWRHHVLPITLRALFNWLLLDGRFYRPLFAALPRLPAALRARRAEKRAARRGDREVFDGIRKSWDEARAKIAALPARERTS